MAMKLITNAVPQTRAGSKNADNTICFIQRLPPLLAKRDPPKYPLTGDVAAYTKIDVDNKDPLSVYNSPTIANNITAKVTTVT